MTVLAIKIPHIFSLRARSTKKYNFEEVADFDDIVEDNYEWKSRFAGFSGSTQSPSSVYFRNSDSIQEKTSSSSDSKSESCKI